MPRVWICSDVFSCLRSSCRKPTAMTITTEGSCISIRCYVSLSVVPVAAPTSAGHCSQTPVTFSDVNILESTLYNPTFLRNVGNHVERAWCAGWQSMHDWTQDSVFWLSRLDFGETISTLMLLADAHTNRTMLFDSSFIEVFVWYSIRWVQIDIVLWYTYRWYFIMKIPLFSSFKHIICIHRFYLSTVCPCHVLPLTNSVDISRPFPFPFQI